ncbi:MAG: hypothetical protein EPO43_13530 [Rugosibacter sp.]|nr:MAG: hypothetical protein EPO43_13530 [Rugosibacter sp.]
MDLHLFNSGNSYCWVLLANSLFILEFVWIIGHIESPNVKVTGAARLHRAASSDRRERGRPQG